MAGKHGNYVKVRALPYGNVAPIERMVDGKKVKYAGSCGISIQGKRLLPGDEAVCRRMAALEILSSSAVPPIEIIENAPAPVEDEDDLEDEID